jgi:hypothetical protein
MDFHQERVILATSSRQRFSSIPCKGRYLSQYQDSITNKACAGLFVPTKKLIASSLETFTTKTIAIPGFSGNILSKKSTFNLDLCYSTDGGGLADMHRWKLDHAEVFLIQPTPWQS